MRWKKEPQNGGHFFLFPKGKGCDLLKRLTLNSAWVFRKHHPELLIQSWVVSQEASNLGEACVRRASLHEERGGVSLEKPE